MSPNHASGAGASPFRVAQLRRLAVQAETFVAEQLGGVRRDDPYDPLGDVLLPSGEIVDVKCVPIGFTFVDGGDHRPHSDVIVVERDERERSFRLVGRVPRQMFRLGYPPVANSQECWMVRPTAIRPIDARNSPARTDEEPVPESRSRGSSLQKFVLGVDSAPGEDRLERRRRQNREADRRRRARVASAAGLGWAFPDDVPRGLGDNPGSGRSPVLKGDGDDPDRR